MKKFQQAYKSSTKSQISCNVYNLSSKPKELNDLSIILPIEIQSIIHGFDKGYWKKYKLREEDSECYEGWVNKNGEKHGYGVLYDDKWYCEKYPDIIPNDFWGEDYCWGHPMVYCGYWKNNKKHGKGFICSEGKLQKIGEFRDGYFKDGWGFGYYGYINIKVIKKFVGTQAFGEYCIHKDKNGNFELNDCNRIEYEDRIYENIQLFGTGMFKNGMMYHGICIEKDCRDQVEQFINRVPHKEQIKQYLESKLKKLSM